MAKLEQIVDNDTATSTATSTRDAPSVTKRTGRIAAATSTASTSQELEEEELDEGEEDDDEDDSDSDGSDSSDIDDIPDPEKWRIIRESGIMDQVKASDDQQGSRSSRRSRRHGHHSTSEVDDDSNRDYVFEGIFFSIPTTCLFVVMDILVHRQFGEAYGGGDIFRKVVKVFPAVLFMVYFSNKAKKHPVTQGSMFLVSTLCGCYFLHTMFRSPAMGIMLRAPGIITILVYCIVQLNLLPAVISLALCGLYYQYGNVKY